MKVFFEGVLITFVFLLFICAMFVPILLGIATGSSGWLLLYFIIVPCIGGWANWHFQKVLK